MEKPKPCEEEMWAGPSGQRWLANAQGFEEMIRPIGEELVQRASLARGEHVIEIGCGAGGMSMDMAKYVAPGGSVTGLDISPGLVGEATRRASAAGLGETVRFVCADAARTNLPAGKADCMVSRFGTMFFTEPYLAFVHLHGLLRPGGRLMMACWAPLQENGWMLEVRTLIAAHFDVPIPPPGIPGPFAFDEPNYLRDILTKAQFSQIEITKWQTNLFVGGPGLAPDSAADFLLHALSMAQRVLDAPEPLATRVRKELCDRLGKYMTSGGVSMPASVWFAAARA